jgi:hypothetical protein
MEKKWYESKSIWGGVLVFIGAGLTGIGLEQYGAPVSSFGIALGFVGLRTSMK